MLSPAIEPAAPTPTSPSADALTPFHQRLIAEELALSQVGAARLAGALTGATIDLNPHQIEAAAFALEALPRGGCALADEVGLGKTIEAGIVLTQLESEGRSRLLILCPASLRAQWQGELADKFGLPAVIIDGDFARAFRGPNCFDQQVPVIASIPFAALRAEELSRVAWDAVVIDEAHRLRNSWRPSMKTGRALRTALAGRPKLLLTATPLQNDLMELWGLLSLLDESVLGPEHAFRSRHPEGEDGSPARLSELKRRIAPVVHRTLRRQVREYVRFTSRRSLAEDFTPTPEERDLYEKVSDWLRRSRALADSPGRRTLLTLVYRKLLASSTYAIAPTLAKLADGIEARLRAARPVRPELAESAAGEEALEFGDELEELLDDDDSEAVPLAELESELCELRAYAALAASIKVNSKAEALCRALDRAFTVAAAHRWPEKAVVFTESRRTQEFLRELLESRGWRGQVSILRGDGGGPDDRRALVEDFRDRTRILLSTEAGGEGLNLQFCNLVVNFDLPWNPQRIEQRIGRCHRYGQLRDVLVVNFVNRSNAADERLYELLEKKLNLFDGVFGASDEILGALESGVDFERRILDIYQSCATPEQIEEGFSRLRADLEGKVGNRLAKARELLFERFDAEVRARLRVAGDEALAALDSRKRGRRALAKAALGREEADRAQLEAAVRELRSRPVPALTCLELDASGLPARLSKLSGREGWWFVYRLAIGGSRRRERLLHLVLLKQGDGFRALAVDDGDAVARLSGKETSGRWPASLPVSGVQETALASALEEVAAVAGADSAREADQEREKALRWAEDCLEEPRERAVKARSRLEDARRAVVDSEDEALPKLRAALDRAEREHRRRLAELRAEEDLRYGDLDRALTRIAVRSRVAVDRALIASAYAWFV